MRTESGKIIRGVGGKYEVLCQDRLFSARARGVFRHEQISPEVGDNVTLRLEESGEGYIEKILPRKNLLIRPPLANLDLMLITAAAAKPCALAFDAGQAQRDLRACGRFASVCYHKM